MQRGDLCRRADDRAAVKAVARSGQIGEEAVVVKGKMRNIRRLVTANIIVVVVVLTVLLTITGSLLYYRSLAKQSNTSRLENLEAIARNIESTTGAWNTAREVWPPAVG